MDKCAAAVSGLYGAGEFVRPFLPENSEKEFFFDWGLLKHETADLSEGLALVHTVRRAESYRARAKAGASGTG